MDVFSNVRVEKNLGVSAISKECDHKYICPKCGNSTAGISDEIEYSIKKGKYLSCMHCGKKFQYPYKDIKKCMEHSSYKIEHGVIKQIR